MELDDVSYENWTLEDLGDDDADCDYDGRQVVATIYGTTRRDEIIVVGAHLDDLPKKKKAPGADDNASGVGAVLAIADIFSNHEFERTIRFVTYTGEEQDLCGSWFNADQATANGDNIVAMFSIDMVAYDSDDDGVMRLDTRPLDEGAGDLEIANAFVDVVEVYDLSLDPIIEMIGNDESDHWQYWTESFNAVQVNEDYADDLDREGDFNVGYHTRKDTVANFNWAYYTNNTKAMVGTVAHMAFLDGTGPPPTTPMPTIASEDFESGSWSGGIGWSGNWIHKGDSKINSSNLGWYSARGDYHVRLRRGNGVIERVVDLSGLTNARLQFWWKAKKFEKSDTAEVQIYDGSWHTVFVVKNRMDDHTYHLRDLDISDYNMIGDFRLRIKSEMNAKKDFLYIDDVKIVGD